MRRFILIFVAIGLAAIALAAVGHGLLSWPRDAVQLWLWIGAGYLSGAAVLRLMPRWWREYCEESFAQPAARRYQRATWPIMIAYALVLFASIWLIRRGIEPVWLRAIVAVVPVVPLALFLRAALRYLRETDELQRRIETESIGVASLLVSLLYFGAGLLQKAGVIALDAGAAMLWVFPVLMLCYGLAKFLAARRYR